MHLVLDKEKYEVFAANTRRPLFEECPPLSPNAIFRRYDLLHGSILTAEWPRPKPTRKAYFYRAYDANWLIVDDKVYWLQSYLTDSYIYTHKLAAMLSLFCDLKCSVKTEDGSRTNRATALKWKDPRDKILAMHLPTAKFILRDKPPIIGNWKDVPLGTRIEKVKALP